MPIDPHFERDDRPLRRAGDLRLVAAIDQPDRHLEEQVDNAWQFAGPGGGQDPRKRLADFRADARKAGDRPEKLVQDFRTHGDDSPCRPEIIASPAFRHPGPCDSKRCVIERGVLTDMIGGRLHTMRNNIAIAVYRDHSPPHFHVTGPGFSAAMRIDTLTLLRGRLPRQIEIEARAWAAENRDTLLKEWTRLNAPRSI